jgi:translation initiation factor 5
MSNTLNISLNENTDPFFRYKMPRVVLKHEGKGNGVKTVIKNLKEITKSLNRDANDLLQYIASELSVCSVQKRDDYIVNGTFTVDTIQDIITRFVGSHVLCDTCENPETVFIVKETSKKEDDILYKSCMACGGKSKVKNHKINKRIKVNNGARKEEKKLL